MAAVRAEALQADVAVLGDTGEVGYASGRETIAAPDVVQDALLCGWRDAVPKGLCRWREWVTRHGTGS